MSQLCSNTLKEQPSETLPIDCGYARWSYPPDQPEPDHIEIRPQPIPLEASQSKNPPFHSPQPNFTKNKISNNTESLKLAISIYHVTLPPDARATFRGFLAVAGDFRNPATKQDQQSACVTLRYSSRWKKRRMFNESVT